MRDISHSNGKETFTKKFQQTLDTHRNCLIRSRQIVTVCGHVVHSDYSYRNTGKGTCRILILANDNRHTCM